MPKAKKASLAEVIAEFQPIEIDCTCFPIALANAGRLIGRQVDGGHMIRRLDEEGIIKKWNQGVVDVGKAERALAPYLEDHGIRATFHRKLPFDQLMLLVERIPSFPQEHGLAVAMSHGYVRQYHNLVDDLPTAHFERVDYLGPAHDVVVIGKEGEDLLLHDGDPALKARHQEAGWPAGVVKIEVERFKAFYHQGEAAREATVLERMKPVQPKAKERGIAAPPRREPRLADFDTRKAEKQ